MPRRTGRARSRGQHRSRHPDPPRAAVAREGYVFMSAVPLGGPAGQLVAMCPAAALELASDLADAARDARRHPLWDPRPPFSTAAAGPPPRGQARSAAPRSRPTGPMDSGR